MSNLSTFPSDERIITTKETPIPTEPGTTPAVLVTTNEGVPTQVANPWRTTIRTVVQNLLVLLPIVNGAALAVIDYLNRQTSLEVAPWVFLVLNGVVAVTAFVIGLVAKFMAAPGVHAWISAHLPWLAPIPLKQLTPLAAAAAGLVPNGVKRHSL